MVGFRFNPSAPSAWSDAIERHQHQGDGAPLAEMLRTRGDALPARACDYLAALAEQTAKKRAGRPAATPKEYGNRIFRNRRIAARFVGLIASGETIAVAREIVAKEEFKEGKDKGGKDVMVRVSESTVRDAVKGIGVGSIRKVLEVDELRPEHLDDDPPSDGGGAP